MNVHVSDDDGRDTLLREPLEFLLETLDRGNFSVRWRAVPGSQENRSTVGVYDMPAPFVISRIAHVDNGQLKTSTSENCKTSSV